MATVAPKKLDFKAPADLLEEVGERPLGAAVLQTAPLVGTWVSDDPATRGLVKVIVASAGTGLTVHAYGACTPTPCDWSAVPAIPYATDVSSSTAIGFSAAYKFGFKQTVMVGTIEHGALLVETFDQFTDGSGRSNYVSEGYFHKS